MSLFVFFSADGAFFSVRVLDVEVVFALATEDQMPACLNHYLFPAIHAHNT